MNIDFLSPIEVEANEYKELEFKNTIGENVQIHSRQHGFPDLSDVSVAIFGIKEGRKAVNNNGCGKDLSNIRKEFYKLFPGKWNTKIVDLGNVEKGETVKDTYFAVSKVTEFLLKENIIPIIFCSTSPIIIIN